MIRPSCVPLYRGIRQRNPWRLESQGPNADGLGPHLPHLFCSRTFAEKKQADLIIS